jgi:hypothetical protein
MCASPDVIADEEHLQAKDEYKEDAYLIISLFFFLERFQEDNKLFWYHQFHPPCKSPRIESRRKKGTGVAVLINAGSPPAFVPLDAGSAPAFVALIEKVVSVALLIQKPW